MHWTNVCVEGFCFAKTDENDKAPCGRNCTSSMCLEEGMCPHFSFAKATEREVAQFVPLRHILVDKISATACEFGWKIRWIFWGQLWFNQKKVRDFFDSIQTVGDDNPVVMKMNEEENKAQKKFVKWYKKVLTNRDECDIINT